MQRFADITPALLVDAGIQLGLPSRLAQRRLSEMVSRVVPLAEAVKAEIETENAHWADVAGVTLYGEMRMVRTIIEVVIKDMARQLTT